jgi:hypothetical protein
MSRELSLSAPSTMRDGLYKLWRKFTASFSETAGKTGQFWIDDKPIYRKVLELGALVNTGATTKAHGLTGLFEVVSLQGVAVDIAGGAFVKARSVPSAEILLIMDTTNVVATTTADLTAYETAYVIIDYTLA